jgi:hypothetical protein
VENKDKLFYCISNVDNSIFLMGYLFNDDKLQCDWQKLKGTLVFNAKTNREIINFTYIQTTKNAFINAECFIIYFIYCLFLKYKIIHCFSYNLFLFFFLFSGCVSFVPFTLESLIRLIYFLYIKLMIGIPLDYIQMNSITEIRIAAFDFIDLSGWTADRYW